MNETYIISFIIFFLVIMLLFIGIFYIFDKTSNNKDNIDINSSNIVKLFANQNEKIIAINSKLITMQGQIDDLEEDISGYETLGPKVLENTGNIATNTTSIATNTGGIATNTGSIATNTAKATTIDRNKELAEINNLNLRSNRQNLDALFTHANTHTHTEPNTVIASPLDAFAALEDTPAPLSS